MVSAAVQMPDDPVAIFQQTGIHRNFRNREMSHRKDSDDSYGINRRQDTYVAKEKFQGFEMLSISQWWANLDQASKDLDKTIFRDLSPTPIP